MAVVLDNPWITGDASGVDLNNTKSAMCGYEACVAVKNDGTVEQWGHLTYEGNANVDLINVDSAMCGLHACVALKNDGTAIAWGDSTDGGDTSSVDLTNVASTMCGERVCVALQHDGTAETWGRSSHGGDTSSVDLTNVASVMCGGDACVALKNDGTAEAWGLPSTGGDASNVTLINVASIMCGGRACVAVKNDGTAEAWGHPNLGGDASNANLTNVASAMCGKFSCVALKHDGTAEAWGHSEYGGDASTVDLNNLKMSACTTEDTSSSSPSTQPSKAPAVSPTYAPSAVPECMDSDMILESAWDNYNALIIDHNSDLLDTDEIFVSIQVPVYARNVKIDFNDKQTHYNYTESNPNGWDVDMPDVCYEVISKSFTYSSLQEEEGMVVTDGFVNFRFDVYYHPNPTYTYGRIKQIERDVSFRIRIPTTRSLTVFEPATVSPLNVSQYFPSVSPTYRPTLDPSTHLTREMFQIYMEVENVTPENKEDVCQATIDAIRLEYSGFLEQRLCDLQEYTVRRAVLADATLTIQLRVANMSKVEEIVEAESFIATIVLPDGVVIHSLNGIVVRYEESYAPTVIPTMIPTYPPSTMPITSSPSMSPTISYPSFSPSTSPFYSPSTSPSKMPA